MPDVHRNSPCQEPTHQLNTTNTSICIAEVLVLYLPVVCLLGRAAAPLHTFQCQAHACQVDTVAGRGEVTCLPALLSVVVSQAGMSHE